MTRNIRSGNPWVALSVLVLGLFMTLLDLTIVNVGIPSITSGLQATLDQVLWILNAYSLLYAVLLITCGRLGDVFGPRNLFVAGIGIFTVASGLSGLAKDPTQLILARALQGLGAAVAAPQAMPMVLSLFPAERRAGVFAIYGTVGGLAVLLGPVLGGFLVTQFSWRAIFYVNLPIGVATIGLAVALVPDLRPGRRHRFDLLGVALATLGLFAIVFGLIEGQRYDWGVVTGFVTIPEILVAGVVILLLFGFVQARRQRAEPLLPFKVFRDRNFSVLTVAMACMGFAMLGFYLPMTIYLQSVLGLSAVAAGLTIAPQPLAMILSSGVAAGLSAKVSPKYLLIPGLVVFAAGMAYIDWALIPGADRWSLLPGLLASGLGLGFVWSPMFALGTRDLTPELGGVASGVVNTIQELGGVLAGAVIGALLQVQLSDALRRRSVEYATSLPPQLRRGFVDAFQGVVHKGLQVGAGETGSAVPSQVQAVAKLVFQHAFVDAARLSMLLPIGAVLFAAIIVLAARAHPVAADMQTEPLAVAGQHV